MNHCLIQALVKSKPQIRYTKENQTPIAEMIVTFKGLRNEDPRRELKVVGWGSIAQEMVDNLIEGENLVVEGRLRMNSVTRKDGTKEKQAELTASKIHHITLQDSSSTDEESVSPKDNLSNTNSEKESSDKSKWNSSPLVPEIDEIPF